MKLQIDTTAKTVKVEEKVNLEALYEALQRFFPNGEWKAFSLETNTTIIGWSNPIYVPYYPTITPLPYPWWTGGITYCDSGNVIGTTQNEPTPSNYSICSGVYNIEMG